MTKNGIIRYATMSDLEAIVKYNQALAKETEHIELPTDVTTTGVRMLLEDKSKGQYFVTEVDGQVIAQLMITYEWSDWRAGSVWWIQSVYVDIAHRKQGHFKRLYDHVKIACKEAQSPGLRLYSEYENHNAIKTYEKLGMVSRYKLYEDLFTEY